MTADRIRELTWEERATWGECSVCGAKHGQACNGAVGIPLGLTANGGLPPNGAHLGRLQQAPSAIREIPVR